MGISFNKVRNMGLGMIILIVFVISLFSIFNVNRISQSLHIISENDIPVLKTLELTNNLIKEAAHSFELYIRRERIEINDVLTPLDRLIRECRLLEDIVGKEESLTAKKLTRSTKLVKSSILSFAEQEQISPFGDTAEQIKKSALKAQAETHKTVIKISEEILRRAEPAKVPLLEKIGLINELLSNIVNSFEKYIQRERIEIDDVLMPLDRLTNELPLIERLVSNAVLPMAKKMAHKIDFFRRWVLAYAEQETNGSIASDDLEAIKESAEKAQAEAHNFMVELTGVISDRINSSQKEMLFHSRNIQKFVTAGLTAAVVITLLVAILIGHALTKPISRLIEGTKKLANGELNYRVKIESKDTISQLASSFNKMAEDLQRTTNSHIQEINERKKTQELLSHMQREAEAANRAKSDFLANMSHELRTPLNHIIGFTELVVDKQFGELNASQEEYLNDVLASSNHLLSLINDILDLSKVEAGKLELELSDVNVKTLIENGQTMIKEKVLKHCIKLSTDLDGIPEYLKADERKLKQILYNLLSNAVKFTPNGGRILLTAKHVSNTDEGVRNLSNAAKNYVQISVEDTGTGLKKEDIARIFQPFEQAESSASRRYQGTGLGLSLTKRLVKLHGGKIWAESEGVGKGATFSFCIPV